MERVFKGMSHLIGFLIVAILAFQITNYKLKIYKENSTPVENVSAKEIEKRLNCLALNIYREAGHEPFEGKVAVAQVTLNRVEHPAFPKDICSVVYQKTFFMEKVVCQFSWYCDSVHRTRPINNQYYQESYEVAKKVMLEGFKLDSVKDAIYYHAVYVNPKWQHEKVAKIGQHIFYNERTKK